MWIENSPDFLNHFPEFRILNLIIAGCETVKVMWFHLKNNTHFVYDFFFFLFNDGNHKTHRKS